MKKDFLMTLLEKGWRKELQPGQFKEELGWHVAELAGQIQDVNFHFASVAAQVVADAPHDEKFRGSAIVDTLRVLTVRPLLEERDLCQDRLIIGKAFEVNLENPQLAAALLSLAL